MSPSLPLGSTSYVTALPQASRDAMHNNLAPCADACAMLCYRYRD